MRVRAFYQQSTGQLISFLVPPDLRGFFEIFAVAARDHTLKSTAWATYIN
jgi:hypothetical protein